MKRFWSRCREVAVGSELNPPYEALLTIATEHICKLSGGLVLE